MKYTYLRQHLLTLFTVSALLGANNVSHAQWRYHSTRDFVIAYSQSDVHAANQTLGLLQSAYARLLPVFGDSLKSAVLVFICADRVAFNMLSQGMAPDWGDGLADLTNRRILLLSPSATAYRRSLDHVVAHELIHILMHDLAAGAPLPTWLAEGAAIYYAGEVQHSDPILISRAILTNSLIAFDELDQVLRFEAARASLAYQESFQAVRFLIQRHGDKAVRILCKKLAASTDFDNACKESFGEDLIDFETAYFDWLRQNYRWQFLVDASMITWAAIIFLLAAAIVAVRWRTRKKIAEWEKEEGEDQDSPTVA